MTVCFKRRKQRHSLFVVAVVVVVVFPKTVMSKKLELECRQADPEPSLNPRTIYLWVGRH